MTPNLPAAPLTLEYLILGQTVLRNRGRDQKLCCFGREVALSCVRVYARLTATAS